MGTEGQEPLSKRSGHCGCPWAVAHLIVVALEQLKEAGLCARGALHPPEAQVVTGTLEVPHVHGQVLQPQAGPLPHRGQLGRSEGREESQGGWEGRTGEWKKGMKVGRKGG